MRFLIGLAGKAGIYRFHTQYAQRFVILMLGVTALFFRIYLAMQPGLWADEIFSLAMATGHSLEHPAADAVPALGDYIEPKQAQAPSAFRRYMQHETPPAGADRVIRAVLLSDTSPPLYYLLLNWWTRAAGTSDTALRLFSTLWALLCFPPLWALAQKVGGRKTAWSVCALFALSPPALYYSAEGRMYSLVWFLALSLAWLTFKLARRGSRPYLVVTWSLIATAGLLTHYFFAFVLTACFAWLWLHPGRVKRVHLVAVAIVTGLMIFPWYLQLPDSISRWRITGNWLANPLSWKQALTAPFILAWSLLSGRGPWGGSMSIDLLAAGLYALLALVLLLQGLRPLLSRHQRLPWFWVLAVCLGPVMLDLLMDTNASTILRYALPALPAGLLLAAMALSQLPLRAHAALLLLILLAWLPGIRDLYRTPARPWELYSEIPARLAVGSGPPDLIIIHSIPSGVLGVARYLDTNIPLASWVVQLEQRRIPDDMDTLLEGRYKVALVKVHDLGEPSPAEAWLREHATLDRQDRLHLPMEILYFLPESRRGRAATHCPAWYRSASSVLETTTLSMLPISR